MGAKRLRKTYEKPKRLWNKQRIETESKLREEYGLKNSKELWKMQTLLRKTRREARRLLSGKGTDVAKRTELLMKRLKRFLIKKEELTLDDVLSLTVRDILERRLQSVIYKKHFAKTVHQARQFISHGHISVAGTKIASPSYLVKFSEEDTIGWFGHAVSLDEKVAAKAAAPSEEVSAGISDAKEIKAESASSHEVAAEAEKA